MRTAVVGAGIMIVVLSWPAGSAGSTECQSSQLSCLPSPDECASGEANGVWLGSHVGSAAVCVGAGGTSLLYAGGNPALLCGTVIVAGTATPASDDPRFCDDLARFPDDLTYRVHLPSGYDASDDRYPVLYLLPGGGGDENYWGGLIDLDSVADEGVIVVVPFNGVSFYADWVDGSIEAESRYVGGLVPLIDATYRTIPSRAYRAVAGHSQGGLGALAWTARHPDLFSVAASFSGAVDLTMNDPFGDLALDAQMRTIAPWSDPLQPNPAFGDALVDPVGWHAYNPTDLVPALRDASIWVSVGNGLPGPHDDPLSLALAGPPEAELLLRNQNFVRELERVEIPHHFRTHRGTHLGEYAADDLRDWLPVMFDAFGRPDPSVFDYRSVEPAFSVWGWTFEADPARAAEFLDVSDASAGGVTLTGSGVTWITTPPYFDPGTPVAVTPGVGTLVADVSGRIHFALSLGTAHSARQYSPAGIVGELSPGYWTTRSVTFSVEG